MRTQLITVIDSLSRVVAVLANTPGELDYVIPLKQSAELLGGLSDAREELKVTPRYFDGQRFATALKNSIGDRTLREIAVEVGVSISTLSRLTQGNKPDIDTFATVCYWMNTLPIEFFTIAQTD